MPRRAAYLAGSILAAACGSAPRAPEPGGAVVPPTPAPPAYDGVTECGPMAPAPTRSDEIGFEPEARTRGSLDREIIRRPIRARQAAFVACYEAALAEHPDLAEGTVTANFFIRADGSVSYVTINGFDRTLDACMCKEILAVQFPKFGSARLFGGVQVSYPFTFRPRETR